MQFTINTRLPSLNEVIGKNRANRYAANTEKQNIQIGIAWDIRRAVQSGSVEPITAPVDILIEWHEKSRRRDADNVQSATKFILDALVKTEILPDDSPRWVRQIYHHMVYGAERDKIIVELSYNSHKVEVDYGEI